MTPREFLLEFLKFHYKRNPFRKQETNEKDVEDFMAELPADIEVKKFHKPLVSGSVCDCEEHDQVPVTLRPALKCKLCGLPLAN